jgi:hypothetical protein
MFWQSGWRVFSFSEQRHRLTELDNLYRSEKWQVDAIEAHVLAPGRSQAHGRP